MLIQNLEGGSEAEPSPHSSQSGGLAAADKVAELSKTLEEEGVESQRTLDKFKSIGNRSLSRGLNNVS